MDAGHVSCSVLNTAIEKSLQWTSWNPLSSRMLFHNDMQHSRTLLSTDVRCPFDDTSAQLCQPSWCLLWSNSAYFAVFLKRFISATANVYCCCSYKRCCNTARWVVLVWCVLCNVSCVVRHLNYADTNCCYLGTESKILQRKHTRTHTHTHTNPRVCQPFTINYPH
jgi:hypothetical protein